jgi:hypothetical protein
MEEAPENGKESSLSAHANGMNELYIAQCKLRSLCMLAVNIHSVYILVEG